MPNAFLNVYTLDWLNSECPNTGLRQLIRDYTSNKVPIQLHQRASTKQNHMRNDILTKKDMESFWRWQNHRLGHSSARRLQETDRDGERAAM